MPCWPSGQPCAASQANNTSTSVVEGCQSTKDAWLLVMSNADNGVSGSVMIPVISTLVATSHGTGLTWFGVIDGGAFVKSNALVVMDQPEVCPRASTARLRMSYKPAGMSTVGKR